MTNEEVIRLFEETLDIEANSLTEKTVLKDIDEYDSMAKLSLIVMADDEFNKKMTGEDILGFKTVGDVVSFLQN